MAKLPDNKKLNFIQNHPLYRSSYQKLKEFEKARIFCCHQMDHLLDVARIAYILNLEMNLGLDRELIYGAALLHDIGKSRQYEEGIPHESAGEALAAQILADMPKDIAYTEAEKQQILTAILGHRRLRDNPEPLEALLYQGDKLSRACFTCPSQAECNWSIEKKNMEIRL